MPTNEEKDKVLEALLKKELNKSYMQGIRVGLLTASKVVYDKLNDNSKPLMERIADVKKYCKVSFADDFLTKNLENSENTENEQKSEENSENE